MNTTPAIIHTMLHYHYRSEALEQSTTVIQATRYLLECGLIESCEASSGYVSTSRGKAWISMLCETPLPTAAWLNQTGEVIA